MIRVQVRFFASLRDVTGLGERVVELPEGAGLEALTRQLAADHGDEVYRALTADNVRVAVNQTLATTAELTNGDEVAFLPPVTGG